MKRYICKSQGWSAQNILTGKWTAGQKILSVRDLAVELEVNPNTVMRSYELLQELQVVYNRRGQGLFVAENGLEKAIAWRKQNFVQQNLPEFFKNIFLLGISMGEIGKQYEQFVREQFEREQFEREQLSGSLNRRDHEDKALNYSWARCFYWGSAWGSMTAKLGASTGKGITPDPYYGYIPLNYRGFDEVELHSASSVNLLLVQGDFKVLEHPRAGFVVVRQEEKRLIIEAKFPDHFGGVNAPHTLFISCPKLSVFSADAKYTVGAVGVTDYENWDPGRLPTVIRGFNQDSLTIREEHASNVWLEGDRVGRMVAVLGAGLGATGETSEEGPKEADNGPVLVIGQGNRFDSSDLNILNKGRLRGSKGRICDS